MDAVKSLGLCICTAPAGWLHGKECPVAGYITQRDVELREVNMKNETEISRGLPPNPKQLFGDKKPRLSLIPLIAQLAQEEAQRDGMNKYGEYNWRDQPVEAMTYLDAALRHLQLYLNGEKLARDTKVQNLGAVMACCAILIDAEANGTMIDNRRHSKAACDALHDAEEMVAHLKAAQALREKRT